MAIASLIVAIIAAIAAAVLAVVAYFGRQDSKASATAAGESLGIARELAESASQSASAAERSAKAAEQTADLDGKRWHAERQPRISIQVREDPRDEFIFTLESRWPLSDCQVELTAEGPHNQVAGSIGTGSSLQLLGSLLPSVEVVLPFHRGAGVVFLDGGARLRFLATDQDTGDTYDWKQDIKIAGVARARLVVEASASGGHPDWLRITNVSSSVAAYSLDIKLAPLSAARSLISALDPIDERLANPLEPGQSVSLAIAAADGVSEPSRVAITWQDEHGRPDSWVGIVDYPS